MKIRIRFSSGLSTPRLIPLLIACFGAITATAFGLTTPPAGAIALGPYHRLALKADGTVWSWGWNADGELGDGTNTDHAAPARVSGLSSVAAIGAGQMHSVALKTDGTVWTWGNNNYGQLGDGTSNARSTPAQVTSISGVVAIAAGDYFTVALKSDGTVWCWGFPQPTPTRVGSLTGITAIAASTHGVALKSDGTVWSWGNNWYGELGDGTTTSRTSPVRFGSLTGITSIAAGGHFTVVRRSDGTVWACGNNSTGQLGDRTTTSRTRPVQVYGLSGATAIAAGGSQSLMLKSDGTVWVWGWYGDGDVLGHSMPLTTAVKDTRMTGAIAVVAGYGFSLATMPDGTILSPSGGTVLADGLGWGYRTVPVQLTTFAAVVSVAVGSEHVLVVTNDGTTWAWGLNDFGELGDGTTTSREIPRPVSGLTNVKAVAAGDEFSFALKNDGTVWAWGMGGQLGDGTMDDSSVPVQVSGLTGVVAISTSWVNTLALKSDGTVWTWGWNDGGSLGDGTTNDQFAPVPVVGLTDVVGISCGDPSVAVKRDGTVWAWSPNYLGQLGDGTTDPHPTPIQIPGLSGAVAVSADGYDGAMVLKSDGTVWRWGGNSKGQLGDGTTNDRPTPGMVPGLSGVVAIAAGLQYSMALGSDGSVWSWGATPGRGRFGIWTPTLIMPAGSARAICPGPWSSIAVATVGTLRMWGQDGWTGVGAGVLGPLPAHLPIRLITSAADTNQNGISDAWEMQYFGNLNHSGVEDTDGDGLSDMEEYVGGTDPTKADTDGDGHTDFVAPYAAYNGTVPTLTLLGGNNQYTYVNQFTSLALDAASWNAQGTAPFVNSPISFTVAAGGGLLAQDTSAGRQPFPLLTLSTDVNGTAHTFYQQPALPNVVSQILVTAGGAQKTFTTTSVSTGDSDGNGLPDMWEYVNFGHLGNDANADLDGDGLTNAQEAQLGTNPNDPFNGKTAQINIGSGDAQTAGAGRFTGQPLVARVTDALQGGPLSGAPVVFTVDQQGGGVSASKSDPASAVASLAVRTDANGDARVYFLEPTAAGLVSTITATAQSASITFTSTSGVSNQAPIVSITAPVTGFMAEAPAAILITATASDTDGAVAKVEFFSNGAKIGEATNSPYQVSWTDVPAGNYSVTAVATDNLGATATSEPVTIAVSGPIQAAVTSPLDGTVSKVGAPLIVVASASGGSGSIAKVEFFANDAKIGEVANAPYSITWADAVAGSYALTVKATDTSGNAKTSAPVFVAVNPPPDYFTSFEAVEGYAAGSVAGQNGWSLIGGAANVAAVEGGIGTQALVLEAGAHAAVTPQVSSSPSIYFVDFYVRPAVGSSVETSTFINFGPAYVGFALNGTSGEVIAGELSDGFSFHNTGALFPITSGRADGWLRITARLDFANSVYDLYVNGKMVYANLTNWMFDVGTLDIQNSGSSTAELDGITVSTANPLGVDADSDGIDDTYERANGMDATVNDRDGDLDGDGLTNLEEYMLGTRANVADTDGDGLPDGWEVQYGYDPKVSESVATLESDSDNDGLSLIDEAQHGTDPTSPDTDGDGLPDGLEVQYHLDPRRYDAYLDNDGDGVTNGDEARQGHDPNDYFNGIAPIITTSITNDGRLGPKGAVTVRVTDQDGHALPNAPLVLSVDGSSFLSMHASGSDAVKSLDIRTQDDGTVTLYIIPDAP